MKTLNLIITMCLTDSYISLTPLSKKNLYVTLSPPLPHPIPTLAPHPHPPSPFTYRCLPALFFHLFIFIAFPLPYPILSCPLRSSFPFCLPPHRPSTYIPYIYIQTLQQQGGVSFDDDTISPPKNTVGWLVIDYKDRGWRKVER